MNVGADGRRRAKRQAWGVGALSAAMAVSLMSTGVAQGRTGADDAIASTVRVLAVNPALGNSVGIHVVDVESGESIIGVQSDRGFIPASTMKIITAYTSLRSMGADHRFTTTVRLSQEATIVIEGGGDPILTRSDLGALAKKTKRKLRRLGVSGAITVDYDDDLFGIPVNAPGWEAGDIPAYIAAVRGLTILGTYSTDTGSATAAAFVQVLRERGLEARIGRRVDVDEQARRVARFRGNTVAEAIAVMMPPSENNVAEILFRHVALDTGRPATWVGAGRAARAVLRDDGLMTEGSRMVDGSGLSYDNRVTPELLTGILSRIESNEQMGSIRRSLPVAGVNGTLIRRFAGAPASCARGAVAAKTGSLPMTVSTLAGLTRGADGRMKAFAILVNDRPASAAWAATSLAIDSLAAAVHGCVTR